MEYADRSHFTDANSYLATRTWGLDRQDGGAILNLDLVGLWHSLERLPFIFSIIVYGLVVLTVAALFAFPVLLFLLSEPKQTIRSIRTRYESLAKVSGRRRVLLLLADGLSAINMVIGRAVAWLVLCMTLMQFVVVVMRYVFSYGSIQMQESIWYMHGLLFMLGAGYTLVKDGHVRLDIFYREASERSRAWVNLTGALVFLMPFCIVNFDFAWPLVMNSWAVMEGSIEAAGLPYIYLFKTVILAFSVLLALEGAALAIRSLVTLSARSHSEIIQKG